MVEIVIVCSHQIACCWVEGQGAAYYKLLKAIGDIRGRTYFMWLIYSCDLI